MRTWRVCLSLLAPDSFVLGPEHAIQQFIPEKVFGTERPQKLLFAAPLQESTLANPWAAEIHLTSRCPLHCWYCSYSQRNKDHEEISPTVVARLLDELDELGTQSVMFSGGGDPLAWSRGRLKHLLGQARGYQCSIATNGLGLMTHLDKDALTHLNIIQIHIPGFDEHTFVQTTGTKLFSRFVTNLKWLFANRNKDLTQVSGKVVIDRQNYKTIDRYLEFCTSIGFDVVIVKLAGNFETGQELELIEAQKHELRQLLAVCPVGSRYPARVDAIATRDNTVELPLPKKCWTVDLGLYMLARSNGDVFLCVASPYAQENRVGNICDHSLAEIWGSEVHKKIKEKLHKDMQAGNCKLNVCRHLRYNYAIEGALNSVELGNQMPPAFERPRLL